MLVEGSPSDQLNPNLSVTVLLTFKTDNQDEAIKALRNGWEKTHNQLVYFKGKVKVTPEARNATFFEWDESDPMPEIFENPDPDFPSIDTLIKEHAPLKYYPTRLVPLLHRPGIDPTGAFVTTIASYTRFEGGLLVAVCVNHKLLDAGGMGHFLKVWGANTALKDSEYAVHGLDPEEPKNRRLRLTGTNTIKTFAEGEFEARLKAIDSFDLISNLPHPSSGPSLTESKMYRLDATKLRNVAEQLRTVHGLQGASNYKVMATVIWSSITRARLARLGDQAPKKGTLVSPVDTRKLLKLGEFIGCATIIKPVTFTTEELTNIDTSEANADSFVPVVKAITTSIEAIDKKFLDDVFEMVDAAPNCAEVVSAHGLTPGLDLIMTSWARMPVFEADFGEYLKTPVFARIPAADAYPAYADGFVVSLPIKDSAVLELLVILRSDDVKTLDQDEEFKRWLLP